MLTASQNDALTRVGRESPMGRLMRRYWVPALLSWEVAEPDGPPVEVRLLGEDLVAFRATDGRVGLIDAACPHRRVNLFWGRNEEGGLRCVYHGWKFDVSGQCIDMPSEPAESNFRTKVRATAYAAREAGGIVWAYMGADQAHARFDQIAHVLRLLNPEHSISFGVAEAQPDDNLQSLIVRADEGLLESRASRAGAPRSGG